MILCGCRQLSARERIRRNGMKMFTQMFGFVVVVGLVLALARVSGAGGLPSGAFADHSRRASAPCCSSSLKGDTRSACFDLDIFSALKRESAASGMVMKPEIAM